MAHSELHEFTVTDFTILSSGLRFRRCTCLQSETRKWDGSWIDGGIAQQQNDVTWLVYFGASGQTVSGADEMKHADYPGMTASKEARSA
jgi:hypothetical protein